MPFLLDHQTTFSSPPEDLFKFYTSDVVYKKPDGSTVTGLEAAKTLKEEYSFFPESKHEPGYSVCTEDDAGGFRLFSTAKIFANLPGEEGERKEEDLEGRKWEIVSQAAFMVDVIKDSEGPRGLKIKYMQTFTDTRAVMVKAVRKGVIPKEALMYGVE